MDLIEKIESQGKENIRISGESKKIGKIYKEISSIELKKSQSRRTLSNLDFQLAKIKEKLVISSKEIIKRKEILKESGLKSFIDENFDLRQKSANYNEKIAKIQGEIAEINKRISEKEYEIALDKLNHAKEQNKLAVRRRNLGRKQLKFVVTVRKQKSGEEMSKSKEQFVSEGYKLQSDTNDFLQNEIKIRRKENDLNVIKNELAQKISELLKTKYPLKQTNE